ncbi:MAG: hypothetical protein AB1452_00665, partial [Pseudomonadota bacterium]
VRKYRPDLVVLGFYWGNDVWNNSAKLGRAPNPLRDDYDATPFTRRVRGMQRAFARWVWNHSLAYQFVRTGVDHVQELRRQARLHGWSRALGEQWSVARDRMRGAPAAPLEPRLGMPEYDWQSPDWELTRELIVKLAREVRGDGARLAVLSMPANIHVIERLPREDFERFLAGSRIAMLDLFDLYLSQDRAVFQRQFIPGDVHWTAEGHALAARHTVKPLAALLGSEPR